MEYFKRILKRAKKRQIQEAERRVLEFINTPTDDGSIATTLAEIPEIPIKDFRELVYLVERGEAIVKLTPRAMSFSAREREFLFNLVATKIEKFLLSTSYLATCLPIAILPFIYLMFRSWTNDKDVSILATLVFAVVVIGCLIKQMRKDPFYKRALLRSALSSELIFSVLFTYRLITLELRGQEITNVEELVEKSSRYIKLEQYQEAVDLLIQVVRLYPNHYSAHILLGTAYFGLGQYQKAADVFEQVIKLYPDDAHAHRLLGTIYLGLGQYQKAADVFEQAIKLDPDNANAHRRLGKAYLKLGQYQKAAEEITLAIKLDPDDAVAHFELGRVYFVLFSQNQDQKMLQRVIDECKLAIKLGFKDAKVHFLLGVTYLFLGDKSSAFVEYETLRTLDEELAENFEEYEFLKSLNEKDADEKLFKLICK